MPVGVPGELHIGGAGLARGYRGRPDLTEERFVRHPFEPGDEARIYKTGDLARYREDGQVEFLGRLDHQVKVRGFRIELGEIETVLTQHPSVDRTVVLARKDTSDTSREARLVAYVVPNGDATSAGELRSHLGDYLPAYMVPQAVVLLDEFPLTSNGKIDRAALPAPEPERQVARALVAARTPLEEDLVAIWEELLEQRPVGVTDNFFELGGHSLLAFRMISRVRTAFDTDVFLGDVFAQPTIEGLAVTLTERFLQAETASELQELLDEVEAAVGDG